MPVPQKVTEHDHLITNIHPLKADKVLYIKNYFEQAHNLYIYDADLQKEIRKYKFLDSDAVSVSDDYSYFIKGKWRINLLTLYEKKQNVLPYRDDNRNTVIDEYHHLIWQDDLRVENSYNAWETDYICQNYFNDDKWRLPTIDDINTLMVFDHKAFEQPSFYYPLQQNTAQYWLADGWIYDFQQELFIEMDEVDRNQRYIRCVKRR